MNTYKITTASAIIEVFESNNLNYALNRAEWFGEKVKLVKVVFHVIAIQEDEDRGRAFYDCEYVEGTFATRAEAEALVEAKTSPHDSYGYVIREVEEVIY